MMKEKSNTYSFRLSSEVLKQLLVFHGWCLPLGLDQFLQGLSDLLLTLTSGGAHT